MRVETATSSGSPENAVAQNGAANQSFGAASVPTPLRMAVAAGVEDTLALLQTAVLFARNFQTTLRMIVPAEPREGHSRPPSIAEVHFGLAPSRALLSGLLEAARERLTSIAAGNAETLIVEIEFHASPPAVQIHIRNREEIQPTKKQTKRNLEEGRRLLKKGTKRE